MESDLVKELSRVERLIKRCDSEVQQLHQKKEKLKEKRNEMVARENRMRLLLEENSNELFIALSWMVEQGKTEEDLIAVQRFIQSPNPKSESIISLSVLAEEDVSKKVAPRFSLVTDSEQSISDSTQEFSVIDNLVQKYNTEVRQTYQEIGEKKEDRNEGFAMENRLKLLLDVDDDERYAGLSWMTEQGKTEEDLVVVKNFIRKPTLRSKEISDLSMSAEESISTKVVPKYFRVVCSEGDIRQFESKVHVVEVYSSFCVVLAPEAVLQNLQELYPVGKVHRNHTKAGPDSDRSPGQDQVPLTSEEETMIKVIQINTPVTQVVKDKILNTGAKILQPLGRGRFILSVPNTAVIDSLEKMAEFNKINPYDPKIDKGLQQLMDNVAGPDGNSSPARQPVEILESGEILFPGLLKVIFFTQEDRDSAAVALKSAHIAVVDQPRHDMLIVDLIEHSNWGQALKDIAKQRGLKAIEEEHPASLCIDRAVPLTVKGDVDNHNQQWFGNGEVIAIADSGLDDHHPDFEGQVLQVRDYTPYSYRTSHIIDSLGHGTHVAGIAVGTGEYSMQLNQKPIRGAAPSAKLFFQSLGNPGSIPADFYAFLTHAYNYKHEPRIRIHSNSWSEEGVNNYSHICYMLDEFVWDHKDFLVVIAAGNRGEHTINTDPWIDEKSITSPGTSKNCLTVGASEHNRCEEFSTTYGDMGFQYSPFNNKQIAESIDDVVAFSGRGPFEIDSPPESDDFQRYKPDVVAPGTFVLSTKSSKMLTSPDEIRRGISHYPPAPEHYVYMSGTSMATPLVAGSAALVRQYLREKKKVTDPSAALIKAIIIHSCQYISYQHPHKKSSRWIDNEQGWGRVNLDNFLDPQPPTQVIFDDQQQGLIEGERYEYNVEVSNGTVPIRVILVYTDYPGAELINNLNLTLHSPSGKYYVGNHREGDDSTKLQDNNNNVEGIVVESPETGTWCITVMGSDVSEGPQDFAIVASAGVRTGAELIPHKKS